MYSVLSGWQWRQTALASLAAVCLSASAALVQAADTLTPLEVPNATAATQAEMKPYTDRLTGSEVTFQMVPIPGGTFRMGSPESEALREADEGPVTEVKISPFWMGAHEVTWDEYEVFMYTLDITRRELENLEPTQLDEAADAVARPTKPYTDMTFGRGKEGFPAICMTQFAATRYCLWLSAKTGRYYRLPTEAEWEYAARAGASTAYFFGDDPAGLEEYAWYYDNAEDNTHPIGQKKPNPWGLYDIYGNVMEWCADQYYADYFTRLAGKPAVDPIFTPQTEEPGAVRGGSWYDDPDWLRSAARLGSSNDWKQQDPQLPQSRWYYTEAEWLGFRVVRPLNEPSEEEQARYLAVDPLAE